MTVAEGRAQGKLPVLVFVHGDDFGYGAGHPYDPSMLVSQGNIIVVTINYRLGILGKVSFSMFSLLPTKAGKTFAVNRASKCLHAQ